MSAETETISLAQIIEESMAAEDPAVDNLAAPEVEEQDDEFSIESLLEDADDETDSEDGDDSSESVNEDGATYKVKVDGELVEVTLKEALAGYQRQADYTRKAQQLAAEREELQTAVTQLNDTLQTVNSLEAAWEEDPVQVLAHFASNTENPTYSVALLIKELAPILDQEFLDMFGITKEVRQAWAKEGEVTQLRRKVSRTEAQEAEQAERAKYETEVQEAIAVYNKQIDEILVEEGIKLSTKQREVFQQKLANYAYENDLTNLKAAYKALKYEESKKKAAVSKRTQEKAAAKRSAPVSRSSAGSTGAASVTDPTDLQAVIRAAMNEAGR